MAADCLRISVTDRCNLRCIYCRPLGDCEFIDHDDILSFEEIHRIVGLLADRGVSKIRLTGGEPLIRKNITELVGMLSSLDGVADLALTTNGVLLECMAEELKAAGLDRINISLDSIEPAGYTAITGFDHLQTVMAGIHKAIEVGLTPVKINAVILNGVNDSEILALARMSIELPVTVRFIEYCPTIRNTAPSENYIPSSSIRKTIEKQFGLLADTIIGYGSGPASYSKIPNSQGAVGFIGGRTSVFCNRCKRLRLTSDGKIKPCLYSPCEYDIRALIRNGVNDEHLHKLFATIIQRKDKYTKLTSLGSEFSMRKVGG